MSIIFLTVGIPAVAARDVDGVRGMRRTLVLLLVANALYLAYLSLIHVPMPLPQPW